MRGDDAVDALSITSASAVASGIPGLSLFDDELDI
jgi:hypothetical protein